MIRRLILLPVTKIRERLLTSNDYVELFTIHRSALCPPLRNHVSATSKNNTRFNSRACAPLPIATLSRPQVFQRQKTSGSKSTQSRPFSLEIYPISLQNNTISPFVSKIESVATYFIHKNKRSFHKESDPISPLFARSLHNLDMTIYSYQLNVKSF